MARIKNRTAKDGTLRYTAEVRLKGHPSQAATFRRLTDARKWIQDTESAIRDGRHFKTTEAKKHTFADLIDRYVKSNQDQKTLLQLHQLIWWKERLGSLLLVDITPALLSQCRDELGAGLTPNGTQRGSGTVVRYLSALSAVYAACVNDYGWLEESPMSKVKRPKEPRGRVRFLSDDERARLLIACKDSTNDCLYLCVILALSTGMRRAELMTLQWPDVDLKAGAVILHKTKNGERRRVPIAGLGLKLLREYAKVRRLDTPYLFPGIIHKDKPLNLRPHFKAALAAASITDFRWHDLRHCTASYLAMNGASLSEIAEVLGHKTLNMVKRYAHLSDSHVSNVVASMNAKIFG
jgi:integrase